MHPPSMPSQPSLVLRPDSPDLSARAASGVTLQANTSDYLSGVPVELFGAQSGAILVCALVNSNLDESRRAAALQELERRVLHNQGRLFVNAQPFVAIDVPQESRSSSPRPASRASNARHSLIMSVDMPHRLSVELNIDSVTHRLSLSTLSDAEMLDLASSSVGQGSGEDGSVADSSDSASFVDHLSMSPMQAREHLARIGPSMTTPPAVDMGSSQFVVLDEARYSRLRTLPRAPLTASERCDVLAAAIIFSDIHTNQVRPKMRFNFPVEHTKLLTDHERDDSDKDATHELLDSLLATATLVLARHYAIHAQRLEGMSKQVLPNMGIHALGTGLDCEDLCRAIAEIIGNSSDPLVDQIAVAGDMLRSGSHTPWARYKKSYGDAVKLPLVKALQRVAFGEPERVYWYEGHPGNVARSFDDIMAHPSYTRVIMEMQASAQELAKQYGPQASAMGPVKHVSIQYANAPEFTSRLHAAHLETRVSVHGRPPVTGSLDLGDPLVEGYGMTSVAINMWQPFMQKFFDRILNPIFEKAAAEFQSGGKSFKHLDQVLFRPKAPGLGAFVKSTDRSSGSKFALEDGANLAAMTALFTLASVEERPSAVPPLHFKNDEGDLVFNFEALSGARAQAHTILETIADKLVRPILQFSDRQPSVASFNQGHYPLSRPAKDDEAHGSNVDARSSGQQTLTALDGILSITTETKSYKDQKDELLKAGAYLAESLMPDAVPASGASVALGTSRRAAVDASHPWTPIETITSQAESLEQLLAELDADTLLFLAARRLLENAVVQLTSSGSFGRNFSGRDGLDSVFVCRDLLQKIFDESLIPEAAIDVLYKLLMTTIPLAMLSQRPSMFAPLLAVATHGLALTLEDESVGSRLQILLDQLEQQFTSALFGLVLHSDRHRQRPSTKDNGTEYRQTCETAVLCDVLVHGGMCQACGKGTFALPEFHPKTRLEDQVDQARTLSWTTKGMSRAAVESVYTNDEYFFGLYGGDNVRRSMMSCLIDFEANFMSLAARVIDKGKTGLTHKLCKIGRGRTTALKFLVADAVGRGAGV